MLDDECERLHEMAHPNDFADRLSEQNAAVADGRWRTEDRDQRSEIRDQTSAGRRRAVTVSKHPTPNPTRGPLKFVSARRGNRRAGRPCSPEKLALGQWMSDLLPYRST